LFCLMFYAGAVLGNDGVDKPIIDVINKIDYVDAHGAKKVLEIPGTLQWNHVIIGLLFSLYIPFTIESLYTSFKLGGLKTLKLLLPAFLSIQIALVEGFFGTKQFSKQFVLYNLLHNFAFNHTIIRLTVSNYVNRDDKIFGWENIIQIEPLLMGIIIWLFPKAENMVVFDIGKLCIAALWAKHVL